MKPVLVLRIVMPPRSMKAFAGFALRGCGQPGSTLHAEAARSIGAELARTGSRRGGAQIQLRIRHLQPGQINRFEDRQ